MKKSKGMQLCIIFVVLLVVGIAFIPAMLGANEQTKFDKAGKVRIPGTGYIMNESDFDNAVIKRGTVKLPNTNTISEHVNATKDVMNQLLITLNVSDDESLDTVCNYSTNECTYRVSKPVKIPITMLRNKAK